MIDYAICQIAGKQFVVKPGEEFSVPYLGEISAFECDKVLLTSEKNKITLGAPFLKEKLKFEVMGEKSGNKLRVAFYKPKANHRKAVGHRSQFTKIKLAKTA